MRKGKICVCWMALTLFITGGLAGCGDHDSSTPSAIESLFAKNAVSRAPDSDGDGIKNDIETLIGTDPHHRDTDRDGLTDYYEVFGLHGYKDPLAGNVATLQTPSKAGVNITELGIVDQDGDGLSAPLDADDDGDAAHDGLADSDGDGVPNKYELYGYTYDALSGEFKPWYTEDTDGTIKDGPFFDVDGNPVKYFKTDPTQFSTDQDPYGDGMEVSGVNMDNSVMPIGRSPMVPAYPDIYVSMSSYSVVPKGTITSSNGGSTSASWANSTTDSVSVTQKWNVSATESAKVSTTGAEDSVSVTASFGMDLGTSHSATSSTSQLQGTSWNTATTTDPSKAAKLVLNLKFQNNGTATAFAVQPTVSLMLGAKGLLTTTLSQAINSLSPGQDFPVGEDVWTVGGGTDEIVVDLDTLRSVQRGAPLFMSVPQISANVTKRDSQGGWTGTEPWANYLPRIKGVSVKLTAQAGSNQTRSYYVYAGGGHGPEVRLRDVLLWANLAREDAGGHLLVLDKSMDKCRFGFPDDPANKVLDPVTGNEVTVLQYVINQLEDTNRANGNILDVTLQPGWDISLKTAPPQNDPEIDWAYYDPATSRVSAYATDYYAVSSVIFRTSVTDYTMEDPEGSGVYSVALPVGYVLAGDEQVVATNDRGYTATAAVASTIASPVWPMLRYDAAQTGVSPYAGPQAAQQLWQLSFPGAISSSVVLDIDGTLYLGDSDKSLYAIDPSGAVNWSFATNGALSTPAIGSDGTIFVASADHYVYAVNPDGTLKWKFETTTGDGIYAAPTIGPDGGIYVGTDNFDGAAYFYALTAGGAMKWRYRMTYGTCSSAAVGADGTAYVGECDYGAFYAIKSDGSLKWSLVENTGGYSAPAVTSDNTVYVGGYNGYFYAIQPNGQVKWSYHTKEPMISAPVIGPDGTIYVGSGDSGTGHLYAFSPDGNLLWKSQQVGGMRYSSAVLDANGTLYVGSLDHWIYAFKALDGSLLWKYATGGEVYASPVIGADGTLYLGSGDKSLYAMGK
jgi:outer membrane protein assembly factor BamB